MNLERLKLLVKRAIDTLYTHDQKLLSVEASEWAIAHRLAIYLEREIKGWNVDCEYNKQGEGDGLSVKPNPNNDKKNARPDIILHHRGQTGVEHNLLVIEMKKRGEDSDSEKARCYTVTPDAADRRKYRYQFGLALSFFADLQARWFENGDERAAGW